jgi:hypothetical protein
MSSFFLFLLLHAAEPAPPVAMVLTRQGDVTVRHGTGTRRLAAMDLLRPDDRLTVPEGEVLLVFLRDGHCERLGPRAEATVTGEGCRPADAVRREEKVKLTPAHLESLRDLARSGRAAVGVLRGDAPPAPPLVTPLFGATVLIDRPTLTWPEAEGADGYRVELLSGDSRRSLWKMTTKERRVEYGGKAPLDRAKKYLWRVSALKGEDKTELVVDSKFQVATRSEVEKLATLPPLVKEGQTPALLLAAVAYEAHGVYDEALRLYEKLAEAHPREPNYPLALANYYERAGRPDKARAAREKARELRMETGK